MIFTYSKAGYKLGTHKRILKYFEKKFIKKCNKIIINSYVDTNTLYIFFLLQFFFYSRNRFYLIKLDKKRITIFPNMHISK